MGLVCALGISSWFTPAFLMHQCPSPQPSLTLCRPNPLHSSVQIGGLGAQTHTGTLSKSHYSGSECLLCKGKPPSADENLSWNSICNGEERRHCRWVEVPGNPHGRHDGQQLTSTQSADIADMGVRFRAYLSPSVTENLCIWL